MNSWGGPSGLRGAGAFPDPAQSVAAMAGTVAVVAAKVAFIILPFEF